MWHKKTPLRKNGGEENANEKYTCRNSRRGRREEAWTNFVVEGRGREQKRATHEPI